MSRPLTPPLPMVVTMDGQLSDNGGPPDAEKKIRREIANSNERRRMQSINAGFQSLRTLLPHHEGEKLSKAAILQQTAEYIYSLEQEKTRLLSQNCHLKRLLSLSQQHLDNNEGQELPTTDTKRRKKAENTETAVRGETILTTCIPPEVKKLVSEISAMPPKEVVTTEKVKAEQCRVIVSDSRVSNEIVIENKPHVVTRTLGGSAVPTAATLANHPVNTNTTVVTAAPHSVVVPESKAVVSKEEGGRSFIVTGGSKQNLDSIVEAIKHLEGDHLFSEEVTSGPQEVAKEEVVEYSVSSSDGVRINDNKSIIIFKT